MAKYQVVRSCGHTETVALFGKNKDRDWRLENVEPYKLCSECWKKEIEQKREEDNLKASESNKEYGLPELVGTPKQVAWAETCRHDLIERMERAAEQSIAKLDEDKRQEPTERINIALQRIMAEDSASWWIDNRYINDTYEIITLLAKYYQDAESEPERKAESEKMEDIKIETTVRPEKVNTETVAEISYNENTIEIIFPEKRDDFREIVKSQLNMKWDSGSWKRKLYKKNGTPEDRAAEAGNILLANGFAIRIADAKIREKAISGDYEPEYTSWVQVRIEGEYKGWFAINWSRDDDYYKAARRLPGSKWDSPSVVVPPEQFEEVLDFAKMYSFQVSELAQEIAEKARIDKDNTLVAKVDIPTAKENVTATGKPPVLEVPTKVVIDDEFKD